MQIIGEFVFLVMVDVAAHYICKWLDQDKKETTARQLWSLGIFLQIIVQLYYIIIWIFLSKNSKNIV